MKLFWICFLAVSVHAGEFTVSCDCLNPQDGFNSDEVAHWLNCMGVDERITTAFFESKILLIELQDMTARELANLMDMEEVLAWKIKRCDGSKIEHHGGGLMLLLETEWDPAQGCRFTSDPCACQKEALTPKSAEGQFACQEIARRGLEQSDETLVSECLLELGYPSYLASQVHALAVHGRELNRFPSVQHALKGFLARHAADLCPAPH